MKHLDASVTRDGIAETSVPTCLRVRAGDARWIMAPGARFAPGDPEEPDWFNVDSDPRAALVKASPLRTVHRVLGRDRVVYVKTWRVRGGLVALRRILGLLPGQGEFERTVAAWRRKGATIRPLAWGVARFPSPTCVLLTEGIEPADSLRTAWRDLGAGPQAPHVRRSRRALSAAVAEALARTHRAGLVHRDLHPRNILVRCEEDGAWRVFFLDWGRAKVSGRAAVTAGAVDLVQLDQHFHRAASRADRFRFMRYYLEARGLERALPSRRVREREWLATLEPLVARHRRRLARVRDRRLAGDGRYFLSIRGDGGWRFRVLLRDGRSHILKHRLDAGLSAADWAPVLARVVMQQGDGGREALKLAAPWGSVILWTCAAQSVTQRLLWTLFRSPVRSSFLHCHRARHRDRNVPLILAFGERRRGLLIDCIVKIELADPQGGDTT